jgi:hypothetical protein
MNNDIKTVEGLPVGVPDALREAVEYLDDNPFNEIGAGSILHRAMRDALAAAPTVKAEQVQCDECGGNGAGGDHEDDCSKAPSLPAAGSAVEGRLFRKRPVTIEAVQWRGDNLFDVITFTDGAPDIKGHFAGMMWEQYCDLVAQEGFKIKTLEGMMNASVGDWIIKGVKGEFYPCKPDIFAATYEPVESQSALSAQQSAHVSVPRELLARAVDARSDKNRKEARQQLRALLNGGEA